MKTVLIFIFGCLAPLLLSGQFRDPYPVLQEFLASPFFWEFDQTRVKAEESVRTFKRLDLVNYSEEEVRDLANAYNESIEYFNLVLHNIKRDMLNKEIRQYMVRFPALYSKQVQLDLIQAKEFYAHTYQMKYQELTGEAGASLATLIPQLIKYAKAAWELFRKVQDKIRKYHEDFLEQHLIEPYHFRSWEEIE